MSADLPNLVVKTARQLARRTGAATVVAVIAELPGDGRRVALAADHVTSEDLQVLTQSLLGALADQLAKAAADCPGCAMDRARTLAALAALRGEAAEDGAAAVPLQGHLH